GSIDRLVLLRDGGRVVGADVVDFKTDRLSLQRAAAPGADGSFPPDAALPPLPDAETLSAYRRQLEVYGAVVANWYSLPSERISLRLAFVSEGFAFAPTKPPILCQSDLSDAFVPYCNDDASQYSLNPANGDAQC
ncbi:MAG: hypothetical protein IIW01_00815, partial [Thermoguttaceae bacterium]|nr:hypothetical protein [Thermoguttaceae bacterium]